MQAPKSSTPIIRAYAIDDVAYASLRAERAPEEQTARECDICGQPIEGEPAGAGLLVWSREGEVRADEPPLCACCATVIAVSCWSGSEDGGEA